MISSKRFLLTGLFLAAAALPSGAGSFSTDFNGGTLPPGTFTNNNAAAGGSGGAYFELTGGVGNSGCLKLTKNINSQRASFILSDLDAGVPIYGFDATFKLRIGGGTTPPADGMAFCLGSDITDTSIWGEEGAGDALRFAWRLYPYSGAVPADPAIRVMVGPGAGTVAWKGYTTDTIQTGGTDPNTWWTDVRVRVSADGALYLAYKGQTVLTNFWIPGYADIANVGLPVRFGFGARTGGANANIWIDDLQITTFTQALVGISDQPRSQTVVAGNDAIFDVRVGNPVIATYQWYSNDVAIAGANLQTLVVPGVQAAASGSKFKVVVTGPNNTVTSSEATLTVTSPTLPPPQLALNFDDGLVPPGTAIHGNAAVQGYGGVNGSGSLQVTINANDQSGAFVINDPLAGAPVYGFTARMKVLVGGGTTPPADGFAFAFGNDIPAAPTIGGPGQPMFEEGVGLGTGLRITVDTWNNDGIFGYAANEPQPAPSIDVRYGSQLLATVNVPYFLLESGDRYEDTIVQLNTDGTLNLVYRGAVVFSNLPMPGFSSLSGASVAIAARTGGANVNVWVDNIELSAETTPGNLRIVTQPVNQTVLVNHAATFSVTVNDPVGATYQWFRGGTAISGATDSSYTLASAALGDSGVDFTVQATKGNMVTSSPATLTVVNLVPPSAPTVAFDFNSGSVPANTAIYGNAYITPNLGVNDSGVLHITDAVNSQSGAFVVQPVLGGAQLNAIAVSIDVLTGGGSDVPADGFSFNWAPTLPDSVPGDSENGAFNTTGLAIAFRDYVAGGNSENPPSPYIGVRYKGAFIASTQIPASGLMTYPNYRTMLLRVDPDGKLYLAWGERVLYNGLQLPNYTPAAGKFGIYGRTGGLNANHWFDNVLIQGTQSTAPLSIVSQPADAMVLVGSTATFTVTVSDPNGATYQWYRNGGAISGATQTTYTTAATVLGDSGATFRVVAIGPGGTATSRDALLTVVAPLTITNPKIIYDFNDCMVPANTILNSAAGGGYIDCSSGVTNSGCLRLTDAINGQGGTFMIPDLDNNQPVKALTVYFALQVGGGTAPPADGFSMVFCPSNDLPPTLIFGEEGTGSGLTIAFDIFDNGGENPPAPSIDVVYKGTRMATRQMPWQQFETGNAWADVFLQVTETGLLDLQYNGMIIFHQVQLTGYTPLAGGMFAFGARTGGLNDNQWLDNISIATTVGQVAVPLEYTRDGSTLRLTWPAGFKLQSTPTLNNPNWQDVQGATSPWPVTMTGNGQFFRLISL